jgi:hypothetical protein
VNERVCDVPDGCGVMGILDKVGRCFHGSEPLATCLSHWQYTKTGANDSLMQESDAWRVEIIPAPSENVWQRLAHTAFSFSR